MNPTEPNEEEKSEQGKSKLFFFSFSPRISTLRSKVAREAKRLKIIKEEKNWWIEFTPNHQPPSSHTGHAFKINDDTRLPISVAVPRASIRFVCAIRRVLLSKFGYRVYDSIKHLSGVVVGGTGDGGSFLLFMVFDIRAPSSGQMRTMSRENGKFVAHTGPVIHLNRHSIIIMRRPPITSAGALTPGRTLFMFYLAVN